MKVYLVFGEDSGFDTKWVCAVVANERIAKKLVKRLNKNAIVGGYHNIVYYWSEEREIADMR